MFEIFVTFILLLIIKRLYNINIINRLNDGLYLYYELKVFDMWNSRFIPQVYKIRLWKYKYKDYPDDYLY